MIVHLIRGIVAACNLGSELSASDYRGDFQTLATLKDVFHPVGRESQISLLVGGTYDGPLAAEIEGRIVVLGDFLIGDNGVSSLGTFPSNACGVGSIVGHTVIVTRLISHSLP